MKKGRVYLVGAGPGDPGLITVKGLEAIRRADVVVYDRLASPRLLRHMKPGAEKIYVGKLPDRHTMKQEEINQLLADLALQGKTVTRLKGGDPAVFGRVGEEAALLVEHGVEYDIVPGITSAISVPMYAGIPVSHREFASSFAVITGHEKPEKLDTTIPWSSLANAAETLVFLMGVAKIDYISEQLIRHGRAASTPVALIRWGTRVEQRTLVGTLEDIAAKVREAKFEPPAVIVVGEVVRLREQLEWFEKKPLFGCRVLVTRARSQASEVVARIEELGGEPYEFPVIELRPVSNAEKAAAQDHALRQAASYDWIVFTSVNGVEFFFQRLRELAIDVRTLHQCKLAAVGPKTGEALMQRGLIAEELPEQYQAEGLLEMLLPKLQTGEKLLLPRADIARAILPDQLRAHGYEVADIAVYENVPARENTEELIELLQQGEIHLAAFSSSSTVRNLLNALENAGVQAPAELLNRTQVVCIGPVTAKTAEQAGLRIARMADDATMDSMMDALVESASHLRDLDV